MPGTATVNIANTSQHSPQIITDILHYVFMHTFGLQSRRERQKDRKYTYIYIYTQIYTYIIERERERNI